MKNANEKGPDEMLPSFTRSLWYAIQVTKRTEWVGISKAAPKTEAWDEWLKMAKENCKNREWDAVAAKNELMKDFVHTADSLDKTPPTTTGEDV